MKPFPIFLFPCRNNDQKFCHFSNKKRKTKEEKYGERQVIMTHDITLLSAFAKDSEKEKERGKKWRES